MLTHSSITRAATSSVAIATGGNPSSLVVFGSAEATATLSDGTVLGARATIRDGRVSAIGHGGFLSNDRVDTRQFVLEELLWLSDHGVHHAWGISGVLEKALKNHGVEFTVVDGEPDELDLSTVDLIVGSPQSFARAGRLEHLLEWIKAGGSMMSVETAWGQIQLGHATDVDDLAANKLFSKYGIMYTNRALAPNRKGVFALDDSTRDLANAERSLRVLEGVEQGDRILAARVVRGALAIVPLDSSLVIAADQLRNRNTKKLTQAYLSMSERPLRLADHPLACALLELASRRAFLYPETADAHPSAAAFPGSVPENAPRVTQQIIFSDAIPGWRSTGLYAPPGEALKIRFISQRSEGVFIQIGAWLDPQDFDDRYRMPRAVFRVPVIDGLATITSPIGGPVYIDIPSDLAQNDEVIVEISGAIEMPRFRLGHTNLLEWQNKIRHLGAPWAEIESDELVLTLPAKTIRDVERPDLVMRHWNRVHEAMQNLEPRSPRHWPDRQYRYVADKKLSWGYMYCPSDAPIVIPMLEARPMVELANFDAEGSSTLWGHYHEMGHSHQNPMWTFGGTGEVTVNIFTVLSLNIVNGYPLNNKVMRTDPVHALSAMIKHSDQGAPFEKWKSDPFLALQTYALLWHEFGWDAFRSTFRSYNSLENDNQPKDDQEKRDQFVIRFSQTVGYNLRQYFDMWGVPMSDLVEQKLKSLPIWMPDGL